MGDEIKPEIGFVQYDNLDFDEDIKEKLAQSAAINIAHQASTILMTRINNHALGHYLLLDMPSLGVFSISIQEAAEISAVDMFYSGVLGDPEIAKSIADKDTGDGVPDSVVVSAFSKFIDELCGYLSTSINDGEIPSLCIKRSMDGRLDTSLSRIDISSLKEWLSTRNYCTGDYFDEYLGNRRAILNYLCKEAALLLVAQKESIYDLISLLHDKDPIVSAESVDTVPELYNSWKVKTIENLSLRQMLDDEGINTAKARDIPLGKRAKRTLQTIIAALCKDAGINYSARGASQRIKEATERLGFPVDDETIKKILDEIPEALATRSK